MRIEDLIANCPLFTRVILHARTQTMDAYDWADPGDVLEFYEHVRGDHTGRRVTALVLRRETGRSEQSGLLRTKPPAK